MNLVIQVCRIAGYVYLLVKYGRWRNGWKQICPITEFRSIEDSIVFYTIPRFYWFYLRFPLVALAES